MRGYFTRLAKQSGVEIGARNSFAPAGGLPRVPLTGAGAPLHIETVDLVDSMSPAYAVGLQNASEVRNTSSQDSSEGARQPRHGDPKTSSENDQATKQVRSADVPNPSIASSSDKQRAQLSETNSIKEVSTRSFPLEKASEREPDIPGLITQAIEHSGGKAGVIRVGEHGSSIDQRPAQQQDAFSEVANTVARHEPSIPSDYVEGIREWLASTPSRSGDIQTRSSAAEKKVFTTPEPADRSSHTIFLDRDSAPQNAIQEFSLSIGSISIIVEEPAQQPKQLSNSVHRQDSPSVAAPPRARDAFALSRSYFRGF